MPDQAPFVYVHRRGSVEIPRRACQVSAIDLQRSGSSRRESRAAAAYRSSGGESNAVDSISRGGRNMSSGDPEAPQRAIDKKKSCQFILSTRATKVKCWEGVYDRIRSLSSATVSSFCGCGDGYRFWDRRERIEDALVSDCDETGQCGNTCL